MKLVIPTLQADSANRGAQSSCVQDELLVTLSVCMCITYKMYVRMSTLLPAHSFKVVHRSF